MQVLSSGEGDGKGGSFVHGERWEGEVRGGVGGRSERYATDRGRRVHLRRNSNPSTWTFSSAHSSNVLHVCMHDNVCVCVQAVHACITRCVAVCVCVAARLEHKEHRVGA